MQAGEDILACIGAVFAQNGRIVNDVQEAASSRACIPTSCLQLVKEGRSYLFEVTHASILFRQPTIVDSTHSCAFFKLASSFLDLS